MKLTKLIVVSLLLSVATIVVLAWSKLLLPDGTYACEVGAAKIEFTGLFDRSVRYERDRVERHGVLRGGDLLWQGDATGLPKRVEHAEGQNQILLAGMAVDTICSRR